MEKQSSIEREWTKALESENSDLVIKAIYEIRNAGSIVMLPQLFSLIRKETSLAIRAEILRLVGEIKDEKAVPLIAESFDKHDYGEFLPAFVAACWQSGLDFSNYLTVFARLFIHSDYITSLEAFTVLEESMPQASDQSRIECIQYIHESESHVDDEKIPLYNELRKIFDIS
jgi:hypothetical protein